MNENVIAEPNGVNIEAVGSAEAAAYDDEMEARYEAFLKASGLPKDFGLDPCSSDSSSDSSGSEADNPEEIKKWLEVRRIFDGSDESESQSDEEIEDAVSSDQQGKTSQNFQSNSKPKVECFIAKRASNKCRTPDTKHQPRGSKDRSRKLSMSSQKSRSPKYLATKHIGSMKKYKCKDCTMAYSTSQSLRFHYTRKHPHSKFRREFLDEWMNKLKCPICQKISYKPSVQSCHLQTHSANQLKSLVEKTYSEVKIPRVIIGIEISDDEPTEISDDDSSGK